MGVRVRVRVRSYAARSCCCVSESRWKKADLSWRGSAPSMAHSAMPLGRAPEPCRMRYGARVRVKVRVKVRVRVRVRVRVT